MTAGFRHAAAVSVAVACLGSSVGSQVPREAQPAPQTTSLADDLDALFDDPILARALVGARITSLTSGAMLYDRNGDRHVVPASNMKLVTLAAAAVQLGWDFRYETRLEAVGRIEQGVLWGDLVVGGGGDPSIGSLDGRPAPVFDAWVDALGAAGITRVEGRLLGDDDVFDDEGRGAGWAWDYLTAGYAAPTGGLSYNENVAVVTVAAGSRIGAPATVEATAGHGFDIDHRVETGPADSRPDVSIAQDDARRRLTVTGSVPLAGDPVRRTTAVSNPTRFFVESLGEALASRGVVVSGGSADLDDVAPAAAPGPVRQVIIVHASPPLSVLAGRLMKDSQNFYAETLLKTVGHVAGGNGSSGAGRRAVQETLTAWGVPTDAIVMYDGSGLSRYNYVTAGALVEILTQVWYDERLRGPFLATLPVGGHDGTLAARMTHPDLVRRVQAKTGTIANMRALSGYLVTASGEQIAFSIIVNHFTAPSRQIDAVVERALVRVSNYLPPPPVRRESSR